MSLILCVHLVHGERGARAMAHGTTLTDRRSIRQRVRGGRGGYVAADARRRSRLYRVDESLRIQNIVHSP